MNHLHPSLDGDLVKDLQTDRASHMASKETRFMQHLLDSFIFFFIFIAYVFLMEKLFGVIGDGDYYRPLGAIFLYFLYYTGFEYMFSKTPGKFYARTKVVKKDGSRPALAWLLLRTLSRLIPFDAISYILDKRGWHDHISGTYVIYER